MRLTDASVVLRPRSAWEAIDLGLLLARRHAGLLLAAQALSALPLFVLLSLCLWRFPALAAVLFWWLKPLLEKLPLYILSRALFGAPPTLREALGALPRLCWQDLFATLLWRRFSLWRSFALPVSQLEGLSGKARRQRLGLLMQKDSGAASNLTFLGVHIELVLWLALIWLIFMLLPQQWLSLDDLSDFLNWHWSDDERRWLYHLANLGYALVLWFWQPLYAACGFSLYLNRRTHLEGWDIELKFRALRQRTSGSACAAALLLPLALMFCALPAPALAQQQAQQQAAELGPEEARLLQQPLSSKAAQDSIKALLDAPPFTNRETRTSWKYNGSLNMDWLRNLLQWFSSLGSLTKGMQILLWALVISLLVWLGWRWRHLLATFVGPGALRRQKRSAPPAVLFGLEVAPQSLPDDLPAAVRRLWQEKPREALGLFYRALLSRLLHQFQLPLNSAHTEGEVLALAATLKQDELSSFAGELTAHWQRMAYGHQTPPPESREPLLQRWQRLFGEGQAA